MKSQTSVLTLLLALLLLPGISAGEVVTKTFSDTGIQYTAQFDSESNQLEISAQNNEDQIVESVLYIKSDRKEFSVFKVTLQPYEKRSWTFDLSAGVNVLDTRHTFSVSTFGDSVTFHTVEQYDTTNPGQVPVPEIANVSLFADGNETKLRVTFHNPAKQTYPLALFVHTTETDIYTQRPLGRPGETESVVVTLDEPAGQRVAGEVRLLAQRAGQPRHGLHQVEFVGVAGDRTDHWNQSYEKIQGPWANDPYRYENESVAPQVNPLSVLTAPGMYPVYGGLGFVFLLLYAVWRKLTSPT